MRKGLLTLAAVCSVSTFLVMPYAHADTTNAFGSYALSADGTTKTGVYRMPTNPGSPANGAIQAQQTVSAKSASASIDGEYGLENTHNIVASNTLNLTDTPVGVVDAKSSLFFTPIRDSAEAYYMIHDPSAAFTTGTTSEAGIQNNLAYQLESFVEFYDVTDGGQKAKLLYSNLNPRSIQGSLTGLFLGGHTYELETFLELQYENPFHSPGITPTSAQLATYLTYSNDNGQPPTTVTPEPSSLALLGTGTLGVLGVLRRRFIA